MKHNSGNLRVGIFQAERLAVITGGQLEELHNLYSSQSIIRMIKSWSMRWAGHVARNGEKKNTCRILVGEPEGKKPLGKPRRRRVSNIEMDFREICLDGMD
jgi:hypothetical protein